MADGKTIFKNHAEFSVLPLRAFKSVFFKTASAAVKPLLIFLFYLSALAPRRLNKKRLNAKKTRLNILHFATKGPAYFRLSV